MLIQDITPRTGFSAYYEAFIMPRTIELAEHMGTLKKITITYIGDTNGQ